MAGQSLKSHFEQARRVWWYTTTIPELRRLKEESDKFKASLSYLERPCLNTHTHFKKKKGAPFQSPSFLHSHCSVVCPDTRHLLTFESSKLLLTFQSLARSPATNQWGAICLVEETRKKELKSQKPSRPGDGHLIRLCSQWFTCSKDDHRGILCKMERGDFPGSLTKIMLPRDPLPYALTTREESIINLPASKCPCQVALPLIKPDVPLKTPEGPVTLY